MSMDVVVNGNAGNKANVDVNGNLKATGPIVLSQAGYAALAALIDAGTVTGSVLARAIKATTGNRQEVSQVTPLFTDTFNYTAQDTARWNVALTTFTLSYASGYMTINSGSVTTANATVMVKSYFAIPIPTEGALVFRAFGYQTQTAQANCVTEFGFLFASGVAVPTDGAFFRFDATGSLKGVINYNGSEITSAVLTAPSTSVAHRWVVVLDQTHAEFWIDDVLQASINSGSGTGQPIMSSSVQMGFRMYHGASTPALANQFKVSDVDCWHTDGNTNRPSVLMRAGMGMMGYQGVGGMTVGSTASYANSATPTAAVPSNTVATNMTGLGGQFLETASIAVNVDGIIASFQVPATTVNLAGRKLVVTGLRWQSMVQTVLAGGPFIYQCGLAFGHTAVSLATAEAAAAKAPRRVAVGLYTLAVTAAVGSAGANFAITFGSPIVVNPGEFITCFVKNIGTVGTSGVIAHSIAYDAHWD